MEIAGNLTGMLGFLGIKSWDIDYLYLGYLLALPFCLVQNILLLTVFKHETPTFLWLNHRRKSAFSLINNLYMQGLSQDIPLEDVRNMQYYEDSTEDSRQLPEAYIITYKDAILSKPYRKSLIIGISNSLKSSGFI